MKRFFVGIAVVLGVCAGGGHAFAAGGGLNNDLDLTLPYVEYAGSRYHLLLEYAPELTDGLYWRFRDLYPTNVSGECGGTVDAGLNIRDVCVVFAGGEYKVDLDFRQNPDGRDGLFWKLNLEDFQIMPCAITKVTGAPEECYTIEEVGVIECIAGCGDSWECMAACMEGFIPTSVFPLAVYFENRTSSDIDCVLAPGARFVPDDPGVQSMMILHEPPVRVPPGGMMKCVNAYCLDVELSAPEDFHTYRTDGVAAQDCLVAVIQGTYGKQLGDKAFAIQNMIWNCRDTGQLSQEDLDILGSL